AQRLVMQIFIHVPLLGEKVLNTLIAPHRPVMLSKNDIKLIPKQFDCQIDRLPPGGSIAYFGTAQRIEVVQVVRHILSRAQSMELGEVEEHFRWCLGFVGHHKHDFDAINGTSLARLLENIGGRDQSSSAKRVRFSQSAIHLPTLAFGEE